jgi:hypothetical protein
MNKKEEVGSTGKTLHLMWEREKIYGYEGSQVVPGRPSGKGGLKIR